MSVVFQNKKQNLVCITKCNDQLKTSFTWGNLGNNSESWRGWRVWGWGREGGIEKVITVCSTLVPKGTTVKLPTTKKKSGQVSLCSLPSVKALMLWEPVKPLWKGSNQWLISYGLLQLVYFWWSLCWGWLKNIMWVLLRSRNTIVTTVGASTVVVGASWVESVLR